MDKVRRGILFVGLFPVVYLGVVVCLSSVSIGERNALQLVLQDNRPPGRGPGETMERFREADTYGAVDVLFLGSSHAYESFDPRIFAAHGVKSFNLGSLAQSPVNSYFVLHRYWTRLRPKLVVMEVYPVALSWDGLESFCDLTENLTFSVELAEMALAIRNPQALTFLMATEVGRIRHPFAELQEIAPAGDAYVSGGYTEWTGRMRPPGRHRLAGEIAFDSTQVKYLRRMIALVKRRGADVILVMQPVSDAYRATISNYWTLSEDLSELAKECGVVCWDFNRELALDDDQHFKDMDHLNSAGVRIFDAALIERMNAAGLLRRLKRASDRGTVPDILPAR